ncbi:helix-turn-helix domain-containing protein [Aeromicrobium choanae]|uniref:GAF domain-containing protein n=1 Tax=Aeromicrobium choanae TaxID=1736691 RepID=A0A1T4YXM2_9ACTN|nr:helix-turn-helix domain-containing protein [Aeromicrobium choanae]SKB06005.1 GAF domain-containing protein [Aeromicrobium choanae]
MNASAGPERSGVPDWLRMLDDDVSANEIEEHRARLLAEAPAERHAALQTEVDLVRTIRDRLDERRRVARELAALNDLARRLATLHDPADVLQQVAVQARQLLAVDVAYIMLRQPDGMLRIEYADGSMGSALTGIELHEGEGLGGEVVRTGRPMWTRSYLTDESIARLPAGDAAAVSEQLGGIVGVPLRVGAEPTDTLGVLLAADRRPRRFHEHEIELLAALAAHAAVALRNATLFESYQAALDEVSESNTTLQQASELRETLADVVVRGGGVADVADVIARAVGAAVAVVDRTGEVLNPGPSVAEVPVPDDLSRFDDARTHTWETESGHHVSATAIALRDGVGGALVVATSAPMSPNALRLLETGAVAVALAVVSERAVALAELRSRGELLAAALTSGLDEAGLRRRARAAGVDLDASGSVLVLDHGVEAERAQRRLGERVAAALGGWSADHAGHTVVLLPRVEPVVARDRVVRVEGPELPGAVGVAVWPGGVTALRAAHESARQTAALLVALDRGHSCALVAETSPYASLFGRAGRGDARAFVDDQIGALVRHDAERNRHLVDTLETYLGQAQHHARTCAALHVHVNTLYQRLDRITELLGDDWRGTDRALELQLALRLRRLAERLDTHG